MRKAVNQGVNDDDEAGKDNKMVMIRDDDAIKQFENTAFLFSFGVVIIYNYVPQPREFAAQPR